MAFCSNDLDDYRRILQNPELGIKLLTQQRIKLNKKKRKLEKKTDNSSNSSDDLSDSDSEDSVINLEEAYLADDVDPNNCIKPNVDLEFQIIDIDYYHADNENGNRSFNIMLFGKTKEDKSVYVNVEGYNPFFYIEIDSSYRKPLCTRIIGDVAKTVKKDMKNGLIDFEIVQAHKFHGFTNNENFNFLKLIFNDFDSMKAYANAFSRKHNLHYINKQRRVDFQLYESNLAPILRFMHIKTIDPIGWCKIPKEKFKEFRDDHRTGTTNINVNCNWTNIERVECPDLHKLKILSFDIECKSEDGKFPQNRDGDKIIQIGMTYSYMGEPECFKQVILCLKKTDPIPGAIVKCFSTEEELMLAFTNEVIKEDPDAMIGFNVFGFDWDYLMNRAKKFNIYSQFSRLSRIKGFVCNFVEQKLESSALGKNNLKYYNTPGRVNIDLMKYVQREYKLKKYSLDAVTANFIRDKIQSFEYIYVGDERTKQLDSELEEEKEDDESYYSSDDEEIKEDDDVHIEKKNADNSKKKRIAYTKFKVKSTSGLKKDDYVAIYYNDGPTDNQIGKKYKVLDLDAESLTVEGKVRVRPYLKRKWEVFWCQAKDDVGPTDIFRLYDQGPKERAIIAKYCLKDCSLCNRLIAKLQILPNCIGMGNVCGVPLSYIFLRGQSIKLFSLVAKWCREENSLIPTLNKKFKKKLKPQLDEHGKPIETEEMKEEQKFQRFAQFLVKGEEDDDDEDDNWYEGATVFDPVTGIHYEPIIVGDYSSLYPSSMIMKNLSHNAIVLDDKYDNLPGYKYHQQSYKKADGSIKICRFAEKIGDDPNQTKATIPRILMKLLATRKKCNALKATEKDSFKKAVWDGLQLAYKVTANSLYGQCGSAVSPISMKDIAACTTSIGRDMLELAKHFVENEMTTMINLIKEAVETNDNTKFLTFMHNYYKDVADSRCIMKTKKKDEEGKDIEETVYSGKEEYFLWLKLKIYEQIGLYNVNPKCIYGDTDSVFFKLNLVNRKTGNPDISHDALKISIKMGILCTAVLNHTLEYPQGLAYEKVYWPFTIISKKRYVGNLYETDPNVFYQKSMGLSLKRRDNADIVKVCVGGIVDQILNKRSKIGAVDFTKNLLMKIITGKYGIDKFITSKTLKDKDAYKDWTKQVHVVLADRIAQRDPGNKPQSNDRVPFVYIETDKKVKLQGERVEDPNYIKENNLKIDYLFYITNQIMKPAIQFLELVAKNPDAIFNNYIIREENRKAGIDPIMKYFKDCPNDGGNIMNVTINGLTGDDVFGKKLSTPKTKKTGVNNRRTKRDRLATKLF